MTPKYRYNTKVKVTKDEEYNGFYLGTVGVLIDYNVETGYYKLLVESTQRYLGVKEEEIELV